MSTEHVIDAYARDVAERRLPAGKYHHLAAVRHQYDRSREGTRAFPYVFDAARADRFIRFAEKLKHYKGEWAGQLIRLQPHQKFRLGSIFAWVHRDDGLRRFRTSYDEIPRKNGKSLEAAIVLLYATFYDGEPGAEGYTVAMKRDQAKIVFKDARQLVKSSGLKRRIAIFGGESPQASMSLVRHDIAAVAVPLGADVDSTDGLNPQVVVLDEAHALKHRGMIDVMETAVGARRQPIIKWITTAGDNPVSPCGDEHDYACKVLERVHDDASSERYFAFIAHADRPNDRGEGGDDWTDEATWRKANPNYGVSVKPENLRDLAQKAEHMPSAAAAFQQKRLNIWVSASQAWLSLDGWNKGQSTWAAEELYGETCTVGIDLASKIDLCAMVFLFPPSPRHARWRILRWVWTPEETVKQRAKRDRAPYLVWIEQGHLLAQPGPRIDHTPIRTVLTAEREHFDIEQIGFDPWHASQVIDDLTTLDGFARDQVIEVPQTYAGMSNACLEFEAEVLAGEVDANTCPLMRWCASNVVVQRDGKDNVFPVKKKSRGRIDPMIATLIARRLAGLSTDQTAEDPLLVVA